MLEQLSSDGRPEINSKETEDFLKRCHPLSSAYDAKSNGRAEATVKSIDLTNNVSLNNDIDTDSFTGDTLQFVDTSNPQNGISQAEILFRRTIRDTIPVRPRSQIFDNGNIHPL